MRNRYSHLLTALAILGTSAVHAEEQQFGDWTVDLTTDKTGVFAATVNDSGSVLAELCTFEDGKCIWVLSIDMACDEDGSHPILGNTASGAMTMDLRCAGPGSKGNYRYFFDNWKDFEALIKDSSRVGFAVPMKNEQFNVVRFSLTGRTEAMALAERVAARVFTEGGKTGTSNTTL
jgi:hypothetical protein